MANLDDNARGNLIDEMKDLCAKLPIYLVMVDRAPTSLITEKAAVKRRGNTHTCLSNLSSLSVKDAKITYFLKSA